MKVTISERNESTPFARGDLAKYGDPDSTGCYIVLVTEVERSSFHGVVVFSSVTFEQVGNYDDCYTISEFTKFNGTLTFEA